MAKSFYSAEEAAKKLGKVPAELTELVRAGKLREFRDGKEVRYKADDIESLAPADENGASASDAIVLESADESSIVLAATGSDVLSLEEIESDDSAADTSPGGAGKDEEKKKSDSVVSSVGVSVFDDDELDDVVDPLAQTAISDVAGLGLEGVGSGSGILDLTRESDDTSLGAELLDEIYSGDEEKSVEMGDDTRAGLDDALADGSTADEADEVFQPAEAAGGAPAPAPAVAAVARVEEYGPDALSSGLTAAMIVATVVLGFGGLAAAAMIRGVLPSIIETVYDNLAMYSGGALLVGIIAAAITFFVAKRG